jgi:hypothetical protein
MFGHCLPRHVEVLAELAQGLSVALEQLVEQFPTARISQRFEHFIHDTVDNKQPKGCMSSVVKSRAGLCPKA